MKISPSRAILMECRVCNGQHGLCDSQTCALNHKGRSLDRIENHCKECATDHRVSECTGKVSGAQADMYNQLYGLRLVDGKTQCPLFPYRWGKNPDIKKHKPSEKSLLNLRPFKKGKIVPENSAL